MQSEGWCKGREGRARQKVKKVKKTGRRRLEIVRVPATLVSGGM